MADETPAKPARKPAARKPKAAATPAKKAAAAKPAAAATGTADAKAKFARAIDEARAGAQALGKDVKGRTDAYREKLAGSSADWVEEAKVVGEQAKARASDIANDTKTRASEALASLGTVVSDSATMIDEKVGQRYGDYARTAARSMQETAAKIDAKDLSELGDDAREMVRKSPGIAIGVAAIAGFFFSRLLRRSDR